MGSCVESFGETVESSIGSAFYSLGLKVGSYPRWTIGLSFLLTLAMGGGFAMWETENRSDELWVPQNTVAEEETQMYQSHFPSNARFSQIIIQAKSKSNVLTKEALMDAMAMHTDIATQEIKVDGEILMLENICTKGGGSCVNKFEGVCSCLINSILKQWDYDLQTLEADEDHMSTLKTYGAKEDFEAMLGNPQFDSNGDLISAEAFSLSYFIDDRSELIDGTEVDEIGETWEEKAFLKAAESVPTVYPAIAVVYFAPRSFDDEIGGSINGDLLLVQISYVMAFLFLGANLGKIKCGTGSRWTLALSALVTVGISTAAGFGLSSLAGLFFGPVHSLLPFILLGIGVDDVFVIANAFDRERRGARAEESDDALAKRCARALARAGASITVTSATDLVAFGISASSRLPALSSFCAYAAIAIFFLWAFAATFFTATLVFDERRQRDNRRECLCCVTRKNPIIEEEDTGFEEGALTTFFRKYHAPAILSKVGKLIVLVSFTGLFGFGIWGMLNLEVEDSERKFIPQDSYLMDFVETADKYYPSTGVDLKIVFEGSSDIFNSRQEIAMLAERLSGLSKNSPYIAEPTSEATYQNVMNGLSKYLAESGTADIGNATLGEDIWPTTEKDFALTLKNYASFLGPGSQYSQDVSFFEGDGALKAIRVQSEYVRLTKRAGGKIIDDADRQIEAMDDTRALIATWTDLPSSFPYSEKFTNIEGFKIIKRELFGNVGMAIAAVAVIVFVTIASPMTAFLITLCVTACIVDILGFMHALGIAIDSVSVINLVLAVGLSVDYSAHVGHSFMTKKGENRDDRVIEALADIGSAVLNGAMSTFLAVVVLLFSSSYVFEVLSQQFALTVALGVAHGLILLPVLLSLFGPKPYRGERRAHEYGDDDDLKKEVEPAAAD